MKKQDPILKWWKNLTPDGYLWLVVLGAITIPIVIFMTIIITLGNIWKSVRDAAKEEAEKEAAEKDVDAITGTATKPKDTD